MTFFSLPSFVLTFLPPSLAKPGTGAAGGWQVERVGCYQIERSPLPHFPRAPGTKATSRRLWLGEFLSERILCQTPIVIFILAGVVDHRTNIQTLHPRVGWTIVEKTETCTAPRQRTGQRESRRYDFARDTESFCTQVDPSSARDNHVPLSVAVSLPKSPWPEIEESRI